MRLNAIRGAWLPRGAAFLIVALAFLPCAMAADIPVSRFARLALDCVHREYPNKIMHTLASDAGHRAAARVDARVLRMLRLALVRSRPLAAGAVDPPLSARELRRGSPRRVVAEPRQGKYGSGSALRQRRRPRHVRAAVRACLAAATGRGTARMERPRSAALEQSARTTRNRRGRTHCRVAPEADPTRSEPGSIPKPPLPSDSFWTGRGPRATRRWQPCWNAARWSCTAATGAVRSDTNQADRIFFRLVWPRRTSCAGFSLRRKFALWLADFMPSIPENGSPDWLPAAQSERPRRRQDRSSRRAQPQPGVDARRHSCGLARRRRAQSFARRGCADSSRSGLGRRDQPTLRGRPLAGQLRRVSDYAARNIAT